MGIERVALFVVSLMTWAAGCSLNTAGQGDDEEDHLPDIVPDETSPDVFEADTAETPEEDAAEETRDEAGNESELEGTADTPDTEETEDAAGAGDEGGETVDPCPLPEIPTTGIYLFYCPVEIGPIDMALGRYVEREGAPNIEWSYDTSCRTSGAYFLWCNLTSYNSWSPATVYFNVAMDSGTLWACIGDPPGTPSSPYGLPRLWQNGVELTVETAPNPVGGFNYVFRL